MSKVNSSWNNVSKWYSNKLGKGESYFHTNIVIPKTLKLLDLKPDSILLDLACGEGILSRSIPKTSSYVGFDISSGLIESAKNRNTNKNIRFSVSDVSEDLKLKKNFFTHGTIILAIQNIENVEGVIRNFSSYLTRNAKLLIVMNHPAFRIPRQSGWEIDQDSKTQYRWLNRYYSEFNIPIDMTPGSKENKKITWSFHRPIEYYSKILFKGGFVIEFIEEWLSEKTSVGKAAKMENTARNEFPMFMCIVAKKIN